MTLSMVNRNWTTLSEKMESLAHEHHHPIFLIDNRLKVKTIISNSKTAKSYPNPRARSGELVYLSRQLHLSDIVLWICKLEKECKKDLTLASHFSVAKYTKATLPTFKITAAIGSNLSIPTHLTGACLQLLKVMFFFWS